MLEVTHLDRGRTEVGTLVYESSETRDSTPHSLQDKEPESTKKILRIAEALKWCRASNPLYTHSESCRGSEQLYSEGPTVPPPRPPFRFSEIPNPQSLVTGLFS